MESDELLKETYRLTLANNKMLHKMRRNAFWGAIIRMIVYAALLLAPIWLYMSYFAPIVDNMMNTVEQIQGTGAQAQAQFTSMRDAWEQLQSKIPGFGNSATSTQ
jgi:uncharacterized oligopeptide transporter (OPT) family protein